ncbi:EamA family transporter [Kaustia mangrovi]|uniref:EamA family transporter n=1 Tax=Kaustia mangrovi TaxID=2593653 RepID=A0A7S8HBD6_9HYPH|nr:EamA family transporter [Kaustia mangrovi]QPC42389.1 EamA family transporter [Kaustia mangrovi]
MTTPQSVNRSMTPFEWAMLVTLSVLWGGSFFFVGVAVADLPPLTIVVARVALAALALHIVLAVMGARLPGNREVWMAFAGMGFLNNVVPFTLIVWGQTHIASGLASILNATTPLFTVIVAHGLTSDEKMTPGRLLGVAVGFAGVAIMVGGGALGTLGVDVLAQLAVLAAALSYAFAGVFGRRFRTLGVPPLATATGQVTASSLMLLPVMLIVDEPWTLAMPSAGTVAAVVGLALVSTALAYILYFRILQTAGATNLLLVTFLIPVSAILLGVFALGETLLPRQMVGMALIGFGLAAVDGRIGRAIWAPRQP